MKMTDNPVTPTNIVDLVSYQEGSVVSRPIIKQDKGTVTLFAFDKDQALSEHTAPFDALVLVLEGSAKVTISGEAQLVHSGQLIIMPANQPHELRAVERFKMLLTMIRT
jgi:quercetin dioxygenase-like cupin family protein